jgi:hypothetical protein
MQTLSKFQNFFSFALWFGQKFRACFSSAKWLERNSEHFYLPRNVSQRNYEVPSVFSSAKWFRTKSELVYFHRNGFGREFRIFLFSAERLGTELRAFSVLWNRRNSDGMNQNFRLFPVPWNFFLSENGNTK